MFYKAMNKGKIEKICNCIYKGCYYIQEIVNNKCAECNSTIYQNKEKHKEALKNIGWWV